MAQLLELAEIPWLWPVIPLLVVPPILLSQFCSSDPPAYPTFTQAEATALTQLQVGTSDFGTALPKAIQLMQYLAWYDNCHCTSGTLTPPTTGTPPPSGTTVVIQPSPQAGSPCYETTFFSSFPPGQTTSGVAITPAAFPPGATSLVLVGTFGISAGSGVTGTLVYTPAVNGVNRPDLNTSAIQLQNGTTSINATFPLPVGTTALGYTVTLTAGTGSAGPNLQEQIYCGGAGPQVQTPCCPPDGATQATLNAILSMVTLIQRQAVPFAYIDGATHAGLTGSGVINVTSILGCKVLPHSIPPDAGTDPGDPNTYWLDSWINWGNADGFLPRENLRTAPHLSMPPLAGQFTQIGYTLRPGLTVDIVELVREP